MLFGLIAAFIRERSRRSVAALIVWTMLCPIASPFFGAQASDTGFPLVFCASDPTAMPFDVDAPHKAPSGERLALEHCTLCFSGTGPALPSVDGQFDFGASTRFLPISRKFDTAAAAAPKAGTLGSRAPPRPI
jgi:hypothetical protein